MPAAELIADALDRVRDIVHASVEGLDDDQLTRRLDPEANPVGWLAWHLTRVQDDHLADAAGSAQVWTSDGWAERFALPVADGDIGYGHSSDEVATVRASSGLLLAYHDAVHAHSVAWLRTVRDEDLDRVVDEGWEPPVTLAVRLVSVVSDCLQHAGQAAYVRGILERGS